MQKKLLRFAVGIFTFAVAFTSAPKAARAFDDGCPQTAEIKIANVWEECQLEVGTYDCWECPYNCPGYGDIVQNECAS